MVRTALRMSVLVLLLLAACGTGQGGDAGGAASSASAGVSSPSAGVSSASAGVSPASTAAPAIVGEWQRLQRCSELEQVMTQAGLRGALLESIAGDGWIPEVTTVAQIKDKAHPCRGAVARKHSHFFTAAGDFGSRDANGAQVDDGRYRLVGNDTLMIGDVTFHYKITNGGRTISFTPEIPKCAPSCFEAGWSVSVAYPGYTWQRIS